MSWTEKIDKPFKIRTGDGLEYWVYWMNAQKVNEYNISEFNFPGIEGTFVDRGTVKGRKFNLEFFFQANGKIGSPNEGADHLIESSQFEVSSRDNRPWTIDHPFYGVLLVQPVSLTFDNSQLNVTKVTGTVIETLPNQPKTNIDPAARSIFQKLELDSIVERSFTTDIPVATTPVINKLSLNVNTVYQEGAKRVKETTDAQEYFNLFNQANAAINNATEDVLSAIRTAQAVINAPFQFIDSVRNRINTIRSQFESLVNTVVNLFSKDEKKVFESTAVTLLSSMTQAAIIEPDYQNRVEVVAVIDQIVEDYNTLLETLDTIQTENGGSEDSYIPDADTMIQLSNLVNFTISNLFIISLTTKQERVLILEDDTNLILLAHRLYGLDEADANIDRIIKDNSIGLNEYLMLRKGRQITYYV